MRHAHRVIESYVHCGRIGVLLEIGLDTKFTADMPEFKDMARSLAVQVAAVPINSVEELLAQVYHRDETITVAQFIMKTSRLLGERMSITRLVRWDTERPKPEGPMPAPTAAARANRAA